MTQPPFPVGSWVRRRGIDIGAYIVGSGPFQVIGRHLDGVTDEHGEYHHVGNLEAVPINQIYTWDQIDPAEEVKGLKAAVDWWSKQFNDLKAETKAKVRRLEQDVTARDAQIVGLELDIRDSRRWNSNQVDSIHKLKADVIAQDRERGQWAARYEAVFNDREEVIDKLAKAKAVIDELSYKINNYKEEL